MVVKSNGKREVYDREKIVAGLRKALEKRNLEAGQFKSLVLSIETDIARLKEDVVTSSQIGDIVMNHLRRLDPVAYLRFASVYLAWEDPRAFVDEIDKLRRQTKKITPPHS
jgi:transcriptional repressor NrdR